MLLIQISIRCNFFCAEDEVTQLMLWAEVNPRAKSNIVGAYYIATLPSDHMASNHVEGKNQGHCFIFPPHPHLQVQPLGMSSCSPFKALLPASGLLIVL